MQSNDHPIAQQPTGRPPATSRSSRPLLVDRNEQLVTDLVTVTVSRVVRPTVCPSACGPRTYLGAARTKGRMQPLSATHAVGGLRLVDEFATR
jgi:hypothetical protein